MRDIGVSRKYATNTAFGDLQVEFIVTKDQYHRDFFENWMLNTAADQENRAGFYEEYTTTIQVLKWENASNVMMKPLEHLVTTLVNKGIAHLQYGRCMVYMICLSNHLTTHLLI